ncbi:MAG: hypothetical protein V1834_02085 [Candidatus Micrarchaeota archaeon]
MKEEKPRLKKPIPVSEETAELRSGRKSLVDAFKNYVKTRFKNSNGQPPKNNSEINKRKMMRMPKRK